MTYDQAQRLLSKWTAEGIEPLGIICTRPAHVAIGDEPLWTVVVGTGALTPNVLGIMYDDLDASVIIDGIKLDGIGFR